MRLKTALHSSSQLERLDLLTYRNVSGPAREGFKGQVNWTTRLRKLVHRANVLFLADTCRRESITEKPGGNQAGLADGGLRRRPCAAEADAIALVSQS